jgi:molybdopterin converting factor small subunit
MGIVRALFGPRIKVHVLIRGRIGEAWYDIDRAVNVPPGTTLAGFVDLGASRGLPLREALEHSPHLAHTLMWNGERCPLADHGDRPLADGDQLFLLAPIAGG